MQTVSTAFEKELRKLIIERKNQLTENLTMGLAITTMEQYREIVGRLSELNEMDMLFQIVNAKLNER